MGILYIRLELYFKLLVALSYLINTFSSDRKNMIQTYLVKGVVTCDSNKNELEYNEEDLKEIYCLVYLTKMAIIFLLMSVVLSIFGSDLRKIVIQIKLMLIAVSIFIAIIMCYAVKTVVKWYVEKKAKKKVILKLQKKNWINICKSQQMKQFQIKKLTIFYEVN